MAAHACSVSGACSRAIAPVSVRGTSRARATAAKPCRAHAAAMPTIRAQKLNDGVVPVGVQTTHGPMGVQSALLLDRIIILGDRIDEDVAVRTCAELLALSYEDPEKDIRIFLNCTAGTQYCVQTILDMMEYIQSKGVDISVVGMGCVAGPPAMLLAAGAKGKRLAMPSCRIILSQPLGGLSGTSYEVKIQAMELSRNARMQVAVFAKYTGKSFEDMGEFLVRDSYMSPQEAMELNLIDGLVDVNEVKKAR